MNLIPFVFTILAIISGSILVDFKIGLLLGLIVGLVALQRETHLKIVGLQNDTRRLSKTPTKAPGEEAVAESKANVQYPDKIEPQPSHTWAASIPAHTDRALQVERPEQIEISAPPMRLLTFRTGY
jgi:hypothetical protein